jgi:hypothetical protein
MNRIIINYRDELHYDFDKTGKAILYRNPIEYELDEKDTLISRSVKYSTHPPAGEPGLYDQTPVAQGFTAFADGCFLIEADGESAGSIRILLENGKRPKTRLMFNYYFRKVSSQLRVNNDRELYPLEGNTLEIQLLKNHVNDETEKFRLSKKYYDEFYDEEDKVIKLEVRKYALAYIEWVREKLHKKLDELAKQAEIEKSTEPTKEQKVRAILQPLFNDNEVYQFDSLIEHITADKRPSYPTTIKFSGVKAKLYRELMKIVDLGYDRKHLASVFSELCSLDEELLYNKISHTA